MLRTYVDDSSVAAAGHVRPDSFAEPHRSREMHVQHTLPLLLAHLQK